MPGQHLPGRFVGVVQQLDRPKGSCGPLTRTESVTKHRSLDRSSERRRCRPPSAATPQSQVQVQRQNLKSFPGIRQSIRTRIQRQILFFRFHCLSFCSHCLSLWQPVKACERSEKLGASKPTELECGRPAASRCAPPTLKVRLHRLMQNTKLEPGY